MFQMVVVLKKITIVTMHSEASEEFHVGIIRCLRVLNLLPCSLSSCSFKQMVIMPTSKSIDGAFVHHNTLLRNHHFSNLQMLQLHKGIGCHFFSNLPINLSEYGKLFLASQEGYQPQLVNECDIYSVYPLLSECEKFFLQTKEGTNHS
ncbi:hypothetical protein MUK42_35802 [Musa troglodytarum]|uniref:Uncharacterized protein n=1 Tax=Musa troglodytarum TaxID=320322 RepID=A0A9E7HCB7_9LILI|nr:hypothetical protein MUK42_35802 [Musa troglodytarum]